MSGDILRALQSTILIFSTFICGFLGVQTLFNILMSTGPKFIRDWHLKRRTRHSTREVSIQNPHGIITYQTLSATPLLDLEYSPDISKALKTVTLLKPKNSKQEITVLTIILSRKGKGVLTVKEY
jgi:hypothetical protein